MFGSLIPNCVAGKASSIKAVPEQFPADAFHDSMLYHGFVYVDIHIRYIQLKKFKMI